MTTREKVIDISRKTIEHLKEVQRLRNESLKFYEENEKELCHLLETDDEVKNLLEEVGLQLEKLGLYNMTKQEMLAVVEVQIRKDITRLNKLSVGCLIKDKKYGIVYKVYDETTHHLRVFELNSELPNTIAINKKHIDSFEIIGHEIMLNDVLEWIKFNAFSVEFQENGDFNLYRELKLSKSIERYNFVNWDLSKPLLKDQLEELIKFLYNLIKQQKWNN